MSNNIIREDVDEILRNAELRCELEPYFDESISLIDVQQISLHDENEYLAAILEWERAPVLPIYRWFEQELCLQDLYQIDDRNLSERLDELIELLFEKNIVLDCADHLSDRELYDLICRDILPSWEKKIDMRHGALHWDCSYVGSDGDPTTWLTYYASDEDREEWAEHYGLPLPAKELPLYPRCLPQSPFEV